MQLLPSFKAVNCLSVCVQAWLVSKEEIVGAGFMLHKTALILHV